MHLRSVATHFRLDAFGTTVNAGGGGGFEGVKTGADGPRSFCGGDYRLVLIELVEGLESFLGV